MILPDCEKIISSILETELIHDWDDVINKRLSPKIIPNVKSENPNKIMGFSI